MFFFDLIFMQVSPLLSTVYNLLHFFSWKRNDLFHWPRILKSYFKYNLYLHKNSEPLYTTGKCIYLHNHSDISDFFIDAYTTRGISASIARAMVAVAFPIQYLVTFLYKNVFYFNRGSSIDKTVFNEWVYNSLVNSTSNALNIYPEGTRHHSNISKPLKNGAMHIAYTYNMPIQIIITKDKYKVISLKNLRSNKNVPLYMYRSKLIHPSGFQNVNDFIKKVHEVWHASWNIVFTDNLIKEDYKEHNERPAMLRMNWTNYIRYNFCNILCLCITLYFWKILLPIYSVALIRYFM